MVETTDASGALALRSLIQIDGDVVLWAREDIGTSSPLLEEHRNGVRRRLEALPRLATWFADGIRIVASLKWLPHVFSASFLLTTVPSDLAFVRQQIWLAARSLLLSLWVPAVVYLASYLLRACVNHYLRRYFNLARTD